MSRLSSVFRPGTHPTLHEFGEDWFERAQVTLAKSTARVYASELRVHVYPRLGDRPLRSLRYADFDDLLTELARKGLKAGTIRATIAPVRAMLNEAARRGLISDNPASCLRLPSARNDRGVDICNDHLARIRAALIDGSLVDPFRRGEPDTLAPLAFDLALSTGLRWSELTALRWSRCDFDARLIHVEEALVLGETKQPKTGPRVVPMFPSAHTALRQLAERALCRSCQSPNELVLTSRLHRRAVQPRNWRQRVWWPSLAAAGVVDHHYRWQDLRHTCLSRLIAQGADIALVRVIAGHANPATTLALYTHVRNERLRAAAHEFDPGSFSEDSLRPA